VYDSNEGKTPKQNPEVTTMYSVRRNPQNSVLRDVCKNGVPIPGFEAMDFKVATETAKNFAKGINVAGGAPAPAEQWTHPYWGMWIKGDCKVHEYSQNHGRCLNSHHLRVYGAKDRDEALRFVRETRKAVGPWIDSTDDCLYEVEPGVWGWSTAPVDSSD
jgi:hypothetical protein